MTTQLTLCGSYDWDRYSRDAAYESDRWATTDRAWVGLREHPDVPQDGSKDHYRSRCVGNWLDYGPVDAKYYGDRQKFPDGAIHACAYIFRYAEYSGLSTIINLGSSWHASAASAENWIEAKVDEYLRTRAS